MSFSQCDLTISKSDIIQVTPVSKMDYKCEYKTAFTYPSWVLLENHKKHWDEKDCVVSAQEADEAVCLQKGRTKHKMYRRVVIAGRPELVLVNDNSYVEFVVGGQIVAYVWDKPAVKKLIEKALENFHKSVEKSPYPNEDPYKDPVQMAFHFGRDFIVYCREYSSFPPGAVIVRLENPPMKVETFKIRAYVPIEGYWVSHPSFKTLPYGGYSLEFLINNTKTENCHQFLEKHQMTNGGALGNAGHIHYRPEGVSDFVPTYYLRFIDAFFTSTATNHQLSDCVWKIEKKEYHPPTETVRVLQTSKDMPLTDLKRNEFKEELVMKVFRPDRVARFMGDTWGTEESWLNQI
jgi:hypothetical protein